MQIHSRFPPVREMTSVQQYPRPYMKDIVLWALLAIPASGIISLVILLRDELQARGQNHRTPR
jgi:hypothetical protein